MTQCHTDKPWVVIGAGATIETSFLPWRIFELTSDFSIKVSICLSKDASHFVKPIPLQTITGSPVYQRVTQLDANGVPLHRVFCHAERLVVWPATARIIAEAALGLTTCAVTRMIAFMPKYRVVIAPAIHPEMDRRVYAPHLARLTELGCVVLGGDDLFASWADVRDHLKNTFALVQNNVSSAPVLLDKRDR